MALVDNVIGKIELNHGTHARITSVEGLRALSVVLVFFVHYAALIERWIDKDTFGQDLYRIIAFYGNYGVELFFIISGYLIYSITIKPSFDMPSFFVKRAQRIYPTFFAVLLIYLLISILVPSESKLPGDSYDKFIYIAQNILLLPGIFNIKPMITVSWTLSFEAFFYFILPVTLAVTNFRKLPSPSRIKVLLLLISWYWFFGFAFGYGISRMSVFAVGCLAYEAKDSLPKFKQATLCGVSFFATSVIATYTGMNNIVTYKVAYLIVVISLFFFYNCAMTNASAINRVLSNRYVRWYGNISYSYFLFHGLCLKIIFFFLPRILPPAHNQVFLYYWFAPICLACTIIFSALLYLTVEYPFSLRNPIRDFNDFTNRFRLCKQQMIAVLSRS